MLEALTQDQVEASDQAEALVVGTQAQERVMEIAQHLMDNYAVEATNGSRPYSAEKAMSDARDIYAMQLQQDRMGM